MAQWSDERAITIEVNSWAWFGFESAWVKPGEVCACSKALALDWFKLENLLN